MAEKLTRDRRKQMTRDALLDAATDAFVEKGYEGASLEEIAEAAGFTRGAIYKNFRNKDDLFYAVFERFDERLAAAGRAPVEGERAEEVVRSGIPRLGAIWRDVLRDTNLRILSLEMTLYATRHPEARDRWIESTKSRIDRVTAFLDEALDAQGLKLSIPTNTIAQILVAASSGIASRALVEPEAEDLFDPLLDILLRATPSLIVRTSPPEHGRRI